MKYFSPSYWFKLWLLSAPLFNDKTQGINAKSIDNKKIKDWASNNTNLQSINQEISYTNSSTNYQPYNLNQTNQNIDPIYQSELETSTHKHRHKKSRRIKKQVTPHPRPTKEILQLTEKLIINQNNRREYQTSFRSFISELINYGIFSRVIDLNILFNPEINLENDDSILALNSVRYGYFILPVEIRGEQNGQSFSRNLELVLRTDNLYLQGFIVTYIPSSQLPHITIYYHFDFNNINMNMQPQAVRDGSVPLLTQIEGIQSTQLTGISPDYRDLLNTNDDNVNWSNIFDSFLTITNDINVAQERPLGNLARSLGNVIVVTAESLRFWSLHTHIIQQLINNNDGHIVLGRNRQNPIYNTLVSWSEESRTQALIIDLLSTPHDSRPNSPEQARNILMRYGYLRIRDNESFVNLLARILILPINDISNILLHSNIRVILNYFIRPNLNNCNRKQARQIKNNNYWHEKFCDLKPQIDKIQGKITVIKVLDENTKGNLKVGDMYVGTENGIYLIHNGNVIKEDNTSNNEIISIKNFDSDEFYVTTKNDDVYFLKTYITNSGLLILIAEILSNLKSSDLNKELKLYYNNEQHYLDYIENNWYYERKLGIHKTFNLRKINPSYYNKIEHLKGNNISSMIITWGNVKYSSCINGQYNGKYTWKDTDAIWVYECNSDKNTASLNTPLNHKTDFKDIVTNYKINADDRYLIKKHTKYLVHDLPKTVWSGLSSIEGKQFYGLNWYEENYNYYFQFLYDQWATCHACNTDGTIYMNIGNGIILYNDEENIRTKREIFDINNLEEKNEYKNVTKWTNEFTKSINHEQHLPINNKTNFATNNITSL